MFLNYNSSNLEALGMLGYGASGLTVGQNYLLTFCFNSRYIKVG